MTNRAMALLLFSTVMPSGSWASATEVKFAVESTRQFTVVHTGELSAGSQVFLTVSNLPKAQVFLANLCSEPCNSAKQVFSIPGNGVETITSTFQIEKTGRYYFWVRDHADDGAIGPAGILRFVEKENGFTVTFSRGATVEAEVQLEP